MAVWEVLLMSVALAMDACAVAMTNGMCDVKMPKRKALIIGVFFGFFQFLMPLLGYFITGAVANAFVDVFEKLSAWISFALLAFLGGKMVWEGVQEWREKNRQKGETTGACPYPRQQLTLQKLTLQAIATSIDALAVGVTLQMAAISPAGLALGVWGATATIGVVTFALAFISVFIGKAIGDKLADKAGLFGGLVLLGIGIKILLEGLL